MSTMQAYAERLEREMQVWLPMRAREAANASSTWEMVDRALRSIAARRATLDAEEARCLREAERLRVWIPLGMVNMLDYLERVLGYAPHTGGERMRVARALGQLPKLEAALAAGELAFSAVRELSRVATPATEDLWCAAARGKNVRQIEELVAGHAPGALPDDPPEPELVRKTVRFDLSPEVYARLRHAQVVLAEQHGRRLDDDQLITTLCDAALEPARGGRERAKFQVATIVCERCNQGYQDGAGVRVPISAAAVERTLCDAQHLGPLDAEVPARATQDVPPAVMRLVWRRDGARCTTPGCRSALGLEVHHVVPRARGGSHEPSNLRLQCSACHLRIHAGTLALEGERTQLVARRPNEPDAPNNAPRPGQALAAATTRAEARDALVGLGWKPAIARGAVDGSISHVGADAPLEVVIREALRRCPRPGA